MDKKELKSIFLKIKKDNPKGLEELYGKYHKMVYGIAFSIVKNKEDAEDIMQIVFTKIKELDKTKLPSDKEITWLYTLAKNETLNYLKKKKGEVSLDTIYEIENKNNEIDEKIDYIEFKRLISKLNKKEQEIVSLKILSNFSFQEISELLNEPVGTIKWRYYKSLHSIRRMLGSLTMFMITFIIGIKAVLTDMKMSKEQQEAVQSEEDVNTVKQELQNTSSEDNDSINNEELQNEEQHNEEQHNEMQDIIQEDNETKGENEKENSNKVAENITEQNSTTENTIEERNEITSNTITQENEIKQETVVEERVEENQISYVGIGFIGISVIFFIMTIIFFIKYQLKTKKKLSK